MNFRGKLAFVLRDDVFLSLKTLARCVIGPWSPTFLSLASKGSVLGKSILGLGFFFVSLALASSVLSSTPSLVEGPHELN